MRRQSVREEKEEEEEEKEEETGEEKKKKEEVEDPDKIKPVVFIGLFITALFCLGLNFFTVIYFLLVRNFVFSEESPTPWLPGKNRNRGPCLRVPGVSPLTT
jgi:hypothetical protein